MTPVEALRAEMLAAASTPADGERGTRLSEALAVRKLLRQTNSLREALELLDKHINAL